MGAARSIKGPATVALLALLLWLGLARTTRLEAAEPFEAPTIEARALARRLAASDGRIILFDVRAREEIAVSYIEGSIAVDPQTAPAAFLAMHNDRIAATTVAFYCAIGLRSAGFANNLLDDLKAAGATEVLVLQEGIVAWANADLPLINAHGPTRFVHPYDQSVVKFLRDPSRARDTPQR